MQSYSLVIENRTCFHEKGSLKRVVGVVALGRREDGGQLVRRLRSERHALHSVEQALQARSVSFHADF
jgi:hypothetical protein